MPAIGALSVCLVYFLGKNLFNKEVAIYSAVFFSLLPLHVYYSSKILTDVFFTFFVLLTFFIFWGGYEKENKKFKVLFGFFLALTLLSRYTALWIIPIFLFYFLIREKSFKFLKDKYLWLSILVFFVTLTPWFIYGILEYNHPLGALIHGFKASSYWGGIQSWYHFFEYWPQMFSIVGLFFVFSLIYVLYKKDFLKKEIYFLLIWFFFFLGMAIFMPHKEDRFILAISPVIALISGYTLEKIKKYKVIILIAFLLVMLMSLSIKYYLDYKNSYTDKNICFLNANKFLKSLNKNLLIITDESTVVYYYTKQETRWYPSPWDYSILNDLDKEYSKNKEVYVLFGNFIIIPEEEYKKIQNDLEENSKKIFECSKDAGYSAVFRIS